MSIRVEVPLRPSATNAAGIAAMCLAMFLLPAGDAITKSLTEVLTPSQIAAIRSFVQVLVLGSALLLVQRKTTGKSFSIWSFASGQLVAVISLSLISAFQTLPIATAIAIFFVEPLILTLLAGFILGEKPGKHRYAAIGVGMIRVLIILRPNFSMFGPLVFLPLVSAVAYALNMIVIRRATRHCSTLQFQFGSASFACLTLGIVMLCGQPDWTAFHTMQPFVISGLVLSGILAAATFLLICHAFSLAEASALAPFQYLEILGATLIGFLAFGEIPDALTLLGTFIVLASGMYVFYRERRDNLPVRKTQARRDR